jgi:hypothetical protein
MYQPQRPVIITPDRNQHEHDFQGAFKPESERLGRYLQTTPIVAGYPRILRVDIERSITARMQQITDFLTQIGSLDYLAFLMHGWPNATQLLDPRKPGYPDAVSALRIALRSATLPIASDSLCSSEAQIESNASSSSQSLASSSSIKIILYACSSVDTAQRIFDDLVEEFDLSVYAHTVAGHTTSNPFVKIFDRLHPKGTMLIDESSSYWGKWRKSLAQRGEDTSDVSTLRFRFPLMSQAELEAELS